MGMELIEHIEVGSGGASSIEFTGIPQDGVDLQIVLSARTGYTGTSNYLLIRFNGDSGSNYVSKSLEGNGSSASSQNNSSSFLFGPYVPVNGDTASTFGNADFTISNYVSNTAKSVSLNGVTENNATLAYQSIRAGSWSGTAAITTITIINNYGAGGGFQQYSTASLYKVTAD
jgi:hypothetical protein